MSLRIAMLGAGWIADMHARAIEAAPGATLVAVANHRLARAEELAERHGASRATEDWRALCDDPAINAVVVATPNVLHAEQSIAALAAGKHVLVEKPMAMTTAEGEAMLRAARAAGRCLAVGHMWRFRDEVIALRDRIAVGDLGRVVRTHGYGVHALWGPSGWFTERALAGGGALIDMGIHAIDTARFLLGDPEPVRVQASIGRAYGSGDVDDDGLVLVDWRGGVRSLVESGWWEPRLGGLEADTEVYGTDGYARIWEPTQEPGYDHCSLPMYAGQMRHFVECCTTGAPSRASGEVGLVALGVVERAYRAAAEVVP
jgi:predicted dehydrogenase